MDKQEFIAKLRHGLVGLPQGDIEERVSFYGEMIEDRIEEGLSEEEAVLAVGAVEEIIAQIIAETPFAKIAKERMKANRGLNAWEIILLAVGSPIWLALGISALAVILSLYISLWSVLISFWSAFAAFVACGFIGIFCGAVIAIGGSLPTGVALVSAGLILAGLSIFFFIGCRAATKGFLILTQKIALWMKHLFIKKEVA